RFRLDPPRRVAGAAFGNLVDIEAAETQPAADVVKALAIAFGEFPFRPLLQPTDGNHKDSHQLVPELVRAGYAPCSRHADRPICAGLKKLDRLRRRRALSPQSLEIVELSNLGSEYVHNHVAGIDQHPVAIGQALDMEIPDSVLLQRLGDVLRNRA